MLRLNKNDIIGRKPLRLGKVIVPKLGYLRVPSAFRQIFGSPIYYPEPTEVSTVTQGGGVFLILKFPRKQMEALQKKKEGE